MRLAVLIYHNPEALWSDDEGLHVIESAILRPDTFEALTFEEADGDGGEQRQSTKEFAAEYLSRTDGGADAFSDAPAGLHVRVFDIRFWVNEYGEGDDAETTVATYPLAVWRARWWEPEAQRKPEATP